MGAEREGGRGEKKKGRERSNQRERKTREWEARKMAGRGRKGKEKGGKQTWREVGGWGEIHTRQLGRKTERWGLGRCAWPAWGDRDREKVLGRAPVEVYLQRRKEGRWAVYWLHMGQNK